MVNRKRFGSFSFSSKMWSPLYIWKGSHQNNVGSYFQYAVGSQQRNDLDCIRDNEDPNHVRVSNLFIEKEHPKIEKWEREGTKW